MDLVGSHRCDCKSGYTGSNCEAGWYSVKKDRSVSFLGKGNKRQPYEEQVTDFGSGI